MFKLFLICRKCAINPPRTIFITAFYVIAFCNNVLLLCCRLNVWTLSLKQQSFVKSDKNFWWLSQIDRTNHQSLIPWPYWEIITRIVSYLALSTNGVIRRNLALLTYEIRQQSAYFLQFEIIIFYRWVFLCILCFFCVFYVWDSFHVTEINP